MTAIPSYVRARLAHGVTGPHPDADLLAAFSEGALTERERSLVLGHAALCAECREVLALALPEIEVAAAVPQTARRRSLAPSLRWAAMLAGLTAVGVVALMILPGRHHSSSVYLAKSANVVSPPVRTASGTPAEYDRVATAAAQHNEGRDQPVAKAKKAIPTAGSAFTSSGAMARLTLPTSEAKERQNVIAIGGGRAATAPPAAQPAAPALADAQQANAPVAARTMATAELAKVQAMNKRELPALRWRLSDAGAVLRSSDNGATWAPARVDAPTTFRSLSVFAPHVWAGGADGKVYHSPDAGEHWEVLRPGGAQGGAALSGEIIGLEFTDALHGRAKSSAREVWTTADGGHTWTRQ